MKNKNKLYTLNIPFRFYLLPFAFLILFSCTVQKKLDKSFEKDVLAAPALQTAHVGISLFDPATGKYLYNYQGDKYFVPASNTKIPTCYAAMKYLGDSLVGLRYDNSNKDAVLIAATGDPTLLHPDFTKQPVIEFLKNRPVIFINNSNWNDERLGSGWTWNDYNESYMAERSPMPIYGNVVRFIKAEKLVKKSSDQLSRVQPVNAIAFPTYFQDSLYHYLDYPEPVDSFYVQRDELHNVYRMRFGRQKFARAEIPFSTLGFNTVIELLKDTLRNKIRSVFMPLQKEAKIYSQPTDSLLKPMMHRSDNFFAEQSLLMVSNEMLGVMNDAKIIDTILKTDFKDLPQKPRWADGSGLSRYNLFTPQSFVIILNKMKNEFGMERIKEVFPTGGEGTLSSLYKTDSTFIYAKTGTLSGVVALSGFLYTQKGKLLIFSVLVNNHQGSAAPVRKAIEGFIQRVRKEY